jgi:nitroimidazol reductase NimA-like FMN-containing flavoprotein (pyridoxamine 5'-phosphate oxidase superfamily)
MSASTSILKLDEKDLQFLNSISVARVATIDERDNKPHVVPIIYAFDNEKGKVLFYHI